VAGRGGASRGGGGAAAGRGVASGGAGCEPSEVPGPH
jgi:hypothetical protein